MKKLTMNANAVIYFILSILLMIGPQTIFAVCEVGEKPMKCYWSIKALLAIAIIQIVAAVLALLANTVREKIFINSIIITGAVITFLIPTVFIGGCTMKTMACQSTTFPAIYIIAAIYFITAVASTIFVIKEERKA